MSEPQYVAIYKDRPNDIRDAYKIAIKLAQYYYKYRSYSHEFSKLG
jgi:hypothetical protein